MQAALIAPWIACAAALLVARSAASQPAGEAPASAQPAGEAPPASAQPAAEAANAPDPLEVRVIGDKADALQKTAGSGTLITTTELRRTQPADAAEMLRRVPGLVVRQESGGGSRLDIGVRGLDPGRSRRVLVLEDGIPVAINPYAEPDLYYAPPIARMRAIEVVKGSGSILFGPQTVGGVINFLTIAPPSQRELSIAVTSGERGFASLLARYGDGSDDARYVAQAQVERGDGFRDEAFESVDVMLKAAITTSARSEATLKVGFHDDASDSDDVGLTRGMYAQDPRRATLAPDDRLHLRRYEISLVHEQRFHHVATLRTLAYAYTTARIWRRQRYDRAPQGGVDYARIVGDTSVPGGAIYFRSEGRVLDRTYDVAGLEPRLELRFRTGSVGHTLQTGARLLIETAHAEERASETPRSWAGSLELDESHRTVAFAAYVEDRIAFRDDVLVTPGVRWENARYWRTIDRQAGATGARDVDIDGMSFMNALVPGLGIVIGTPAAHGFGGLHVGFAPPRATSAVDAGGENQRLDPERSLNYELGARVRPVRWLRGEATAFLSTFSNQIVASTRPGAPTELVNGGATRHMGLEAAAAAGLGKALELGWALDLGARYALLDATFTGGDDAGNSLPYAPRHTFGATLDAEHDTGFGGQLAWSRVGEQLADDQGTVAEDVTGRLGAIPAYDTIDVGARYRHEPTAITASVTIKSLLDDAHIVARRPEGIFAGGFRQVNVGVRWDHR